MKLSSKIHGLIDYVVVVFLFSSPAIFGLPGFTSAITYALGSIHLLLTLTTKFEMGLLKIVPFHIHGWIELIVSVILIAASFYLGGKDGITARNFYLGFGGTVFLTWLVSDYKHLCAS